MICQTKQKKSQHYIADSLKRTRTKATATVYRTKTEFVKGFFCKTVRIYKKVENESDLHQVTFIFSLLFTYIEIDF